MEGEWQGVKGRRYTEACREDAPRVTGDASEGFCPPGPFSSRLDWVRPREVTRRAVSRSIGQRPFTLEGASRRSRRAASRTRFWTLSP